MKYVERMKNVKILDMMMAAKNCHTEVYDLDFPKELKWKNKQERFISFIISLK